MTVTAIARQLSNLATALSHSAQEWNISLRECLTSTKAHPRSIRDDPSSLPQSENTNVCPLGLARTCMASRLKWGIPPERDIWFLGVMVPGPYQMGRVVGTSPPPPSVGNSGQHSGQETIFGVLPMVLGSWWEISENGDRGFRQNFDAHLVTLSIVVWPGKPFLEKSLKMKKYKLCENRHVPKIPEVLVSKNKSPAGCFKT